MVESINDKPLTELFKSNSYPYEKKENSSGIDYIFKSKTSIIKVSFSGGSHGDWSLAFYDVSDDGKQNANSTGKGDQYLILSTVLKITKDFISEKHPDTLAFMGDSSHSKVYSSIITKLKDEIKSAGYYDISADLGDGSYVFSLRKNN